MKEEIFLYAALLLTLLTLGMSLMNLFEGVRSFQLFVENATLSTGLRYEFLALIVTINLTVLLALKRLVIQPHPILGSNIA